jgi:hypothetical protein
MYNTKTIRIDGEDTFFRRDKDKIFVAIFTEQELKSFVERIKDRERTRIKNNI